MKRGSLKDILVPIQVVLGNTNLCVKQIAELGPGDIIELNSLAGEPVHMVAAGEKIAKGEVVVIDEKFGIRITEMIKQEE